MIYIRCVGGARITERNHLESDIVIKPTALDRIELKQSQADINYDSLQIGFSEIQAEVEQLERRLKKIRQDLKNKDDEINAQLCTRAGALPREADKYTLRAKTRQRH
jgi:predicted  nucleic acid-binding Zn-ribbon protein